MLAGLRQRDHPAVRRRRLLACTPAAGRQGRQGSIRVVTDGVGPTPLGRLADMNSSAPSSPPRDLTRRYGEGETAVDALRGVSLDVERRRARRRHGPVGLGQVDADAHPRRARQADQRARVTIAGQEIGSLSDNDVTLLRRKHIGFVFQFFNLLPMLTAEENVRPAAVDRRREAGQGVLRGPDRARRARRSPQAPPVRALRRPAAARRDRPRARLAADGRLRRRADRQPRLAHGPGDPRAAPLGDRAVRADDRDGHPRRRAPPRSPTGSCSSPTA